MGIYLMHTKMQQQKTEKMKQLCKKKMKKEKQTNVMLCLCFYNENEREPWRARRREAMSLHRGVLESSFCRVLKNAKSFFHGPDVFRKLLCCF